MVWTVSHPIGLGRLAANKETRFHPGLLKEALYGESPSLVSPRDSVFLARRVHRPRPAALGAGAGIPDHRELAQRRPAGVAGNDPSRLYTTLPAPQSGLPAHRAEPI